MEKGGPPYAADGSLDYAESRFCTAEYRRVLFYVCGFAR